MTTKSRGFLRFMLIVALGGSEACSSRAAHQPGTLPQTESQSSEPQRQVAAPSGFVAAACALPLGQTEPNQGVSVVALGERVDPANAPHPTNESERLLFRQVYESLLRVDCEGRPEPGLASAWQWDASRGVWILTLRSDARFSDGSPVTAGAVVDFWSSGGALLPAVQRLVRSVTAVGDLLLEIGLQNPTEDAVRSLAHTDLTVAKRVAGSPWLLGTRRLVIEGTLSPSSRQNEIQVKLLSAAADNPESSSRIRFLVAPGRDPRDLMDDGVDLLLTRDSTALDYAAALPQFEAVPLPWLRTYVLIAPGSDEFRRELLPEERDTLAHDAIRGESRGAIGPFWWQGLACSSDPLTAVVAPPALNPRIVYDANDGVARDLAERLVGLGRAYGRGSAPILDALLPSRSRALQRAAGLTGEALAAARREGADAAYVMALETRPLDPCRDLRVLDERASWIQPNAIVSLADTRLHAIVRRGHSGITREWDGGLLLQSEMKNP